MLETIEKLLLLQDRDRKIHRVQQELVQIGPERDTYHTKATATQARLETAKTSIKQIESDRKRLEVDVGVKKQQIEKYANQQLQTRKNEEYRALSHEIDTCKADITKIEDQEIALMEQAEAAQKDQMVSYENYLVTEAPIAEAVNHVRLVSAEGQMVKAARAVEVEFGD